MTLSLSISSGFETALVESCTWKQSVGISLLLHKPVLCSRRLSFFLKVGVYKFQVIACDCVIRQVCPSTLVQTKILLYRDSAQGLIVM